MTYYKCQFDDRPAGIVARLEGGTPSPNSVQVLGTRGDTPFLPGSQPVQGRICPISPSRIK